jgi:hypothetical protein
MTEAAVAQLLERLAALGPDASFTDALSVLESVESGPVLEARRRVALVRAFDKALYAFLGRGAALPAFETFTADRTIHQLAPGRWAMEETERGRLLLEWQTQRADEWKSWNERLARYFMDTGREAHRLDVIYHLAASARPESVLPLFINWYEEAERAFDLAQCNALLEMLRLQQQFRGPEVSRAFRMYHGHYQARVLFLDDYYKSGAYFERAGLLAEFGKVFAAKAGEGGGEWIFHIHATGGTGKTMFLRWLLAQHLIPKRVVCARVDLDDPAFQDVLDYPLKLFESIFRQWTQQLDSATGLDNLLERLGRARQSKGWNHEVMADVARSFLSNRPDIPLVAVLDTLEDVTLTAREWLSQCLTALRTLHRIHPNLVVVLSGRYDIADLKDVLEEGEYRGYEIPRFTRDEAGAYLKQRGLTEAGIIHAIVDRTFTDNEVDDRIAVGHEAPRVLTGCNPFKVAMLAELALNRRMTADEIRNIRSTEVAYLIERVILRIPSQPLRWAIRYGAIARHLTVDFIEHVLLPPLREALQGSSADNANERLEGFRDVWQPDPALAASITAPALRDELAKYARDLGWVSIVGTGADAELRFHPDVIRPTRELLLGQPVFPRLQQLAIDYFERRAQGPADPHDEAQGQALVRNRCEAVFHRFQLARAKPERREGAIAAWRKAVAATESVGASAAAQVAEDITGREYAEQQLRPIEGVSTPELLFEAHCLAADLLVQAGGLDFAPGRREHAAFQRHVELAEEIAREFRLQPPPRILQVLYTSLTSSDAKRMLRRAVRAEASPREEVFLLVQLARMQRLRKPKEAALHLREVLALLEMADRTGVRPFQVCLRLSELYQALQSHNAVLDALRGAQAHAVGDARASAVVSLRRAAYALDTWDLATAERCLDEIANPSAPRVPRSARRHILGARLAIALGDPSRALREAVAGRSVLASDHHLGQLLEQEGEAEALLLRFGSALGKWEEAGAAYDRAGRIADAGRCILRSARLQGLACGNFSTMESVIEGVYRLGNALDTASQCEFLLLRAYGALRQMDRKRAKQMVRNASSFRSMTPYLRARVSLFALMFQLGKPDEDKVEKVVQNLAEVQPISARHALLDWCRHARPIDGMDAADAVRLLALFPASRNERFASFAIARAELCRVLGLNAHAATQLEQANALLGQGVGADRIIPHWQLNQARRRLGVPAEFAKLRPAAIQAELAGTPLYDAIGIEIASDLLRERGREAAKSLAQERFERILAEPWNIWHARVHMLRSQLAGTPDEAAALRAPVEAAFRNLGDEVGAREVAAAFAPAPREGKSVIPGRSATRLEVTRQPAARAGRVLPLVRIENAPEPLASAARLPERAIEGLLADWKGFGEALSACLRGAGLAERNATRRIALDVPYPLDVLPWELAPALAAYEGVWRTSLLEIVKFGHLRRETRDASAPTASPSAIRTPSSPRKAQGESPRGGVLLVVPAQDSDFSLEGASGESLEFLYRRAMPSVPMWVLESPTDEALFSALRTHQPALIHLSGAMRESSQGVFLDFETASFRAREMSQSSSAFAVRRPSRFSLMPSRLGRYLHTLREPPFVLLDIASPDNLSETVRMLLQRNAFAIQLHREGRVGGILAAGLATHEERAGLTDRVVNALLHASPMEAMAALRKEEVSPDDLSRLLPRRGAALWASAPSTPLHLGSTA